MGRYLYGAAVQGIQGFIFGTNKLKDIIGASELVESICTTEFDGFRKSGESIVSAAGNIKFIFNNKEACEYAVKEFPKQVMMLAPGVTISQAVVTYNDDNNFEVAVNELETKLRAQRNKPSRSATLGLMGILRSRRTGLPVVEVKQIDKKDEYIDVAQKQKLEASGSTTIKLAKKNFKDNIDYKKLVTEFKELTDKNDWIAVVHIDGNGLGQVIQNIGSRSELLKRFSSELDKATKDAAQMAYEALYGYREIDKPSKIPMRPIVLSGDDHTIVCRADIALSYVEQFMRAFEGRSKSLLGGILRECDVEFDYLTACAGISYVKSKYPFHYAYNLSEELCSAAKKDAKLDKNLKDDLPRSCVMFHKVQDSFTENYSEIVKRELSISSTMSLSFGPYYFDGKTNCKTDEVTKINRWSIADIAYKRIDDIKDGDTRDAILADFRHWLTLLHKNPGLADQFKKRLIQQNQEAKAVIEAVMQFDDERHATPVYDLLALKTINKQVTK